MHNAAQGREAEPLDVRRERLEDAARDVLAAALATRWFDPDVLDVLPESPELQREIGSKLARYSLERGPASWGVEARALDRVWGRYLDLDGDALVVDHCAWDAVIAEFVAAPTTTPDQLHGLLCRRMTHAANCNWCPFDGSCTCWRGDAKARLETMRGAA